MEPSPKKSLLDYFYHWEASKPDDVYLKQPFGDTFKDHTWAEIGNQARRIATYLQAQNLPAKSNIGIVSKNCAEWIISDLGIMMSGHVSVPFYPTLVGEQIEQVLTHSECKILFVGKLDDWASMKPGIPKDVQCISFPVYNPDESHLQWADLMKNNEPLASCPRPAMDELFTIIYTSGTTGMPKGVMMSFGAMAASVYSTKGMSKLGGKGRRFFSFLPLSHVAERNLIEGISLVGGGTVYFAESLETFAENLKQASPTIFLAVPRIWTKFQLGILAKMPQKKLNFFLKIPILNKIVQKKIKTGLGLQDAEVTATGAAPMPASLIKWYRKLGITIQEAYGMTENLGAVTMMPRENIKDGTVGKVYPNMEVSIAKGTGEILTRSDWNMMGYFKNPEATAATIDSDNWIHTGDVGELDEENFLKITGRIKEMYKTTKGEYIVPAQIEFGFADNNMIEQVCVVGQALPQPIALVCLSELGLSASKKAVEAALSGNLSSLNPTLKSYEKIKRIVIMKEAWSVENNCMTPTLKIKRIIIEKAFGASFKEWYDAKEKIIWQS